MTIAMTIDAVSHSDVNWHAINWRKVYRTVRRLQARIVKAVRSRISREALERLELHEAKVSRVSSEGAEGQQ